MVELAGPPFLCIYRKEFPFQMKWCFSERTVIREDLLYSSLKEFRDFKSRIELFGNLQKLCFFKVDISELSEFMRDLPLLSRLKVLMISYGLSNLPEFRQNRGPDYRHSITFDSNSLEKLSFTYICGPIPRGKFASIDFSTPNLSSLVFWNDWRDSLESVQIRFPLKIQHLECIAFGSKMSELKNLETLNCQFIACPFTLKDFKSLRKLELFPFEKIEFESIRRIMNEKKNLRRNDLEIIVCGLRDVLIPCKPGDRISSISFKVNERYFGWLAKHQANLVGKIPWGLYLDFSVFYKTFKAIPKAVFKTFVHFEDVDIITLNYGLKGKKLKRDETPSPSDVLQFLFQANPKSVNIGSCDFGKEFYKQLVSIQSIIHLCLTEKFENLDWDEFFKLKNLQTFIIRTEKLPIAFVSKIFERKFLDTLQFGLTKYSFIGLQNYCSRGLFFRYSYLRECSKHVHSNFFFDCSDDLVREMERLKNDEPSLKTRLI